MSIYFGNDKTFYVGGGEGGRVGAYEFSFESFSNALQAWYLWVIMVSDNLDPIGLANFQTAHFHANLYQRRWLYANIVSILRPQEETQPSSQGYQGRA